MNRRYIERVFVALVAIFVLTINSKAYTSPITVENPGFELPDSDKKYNFSEVPGWSQDISSDSGVDYGGAAGAWHGYGKYSDGGIYQLLDTPIIADAVYTLNFYGCSKTTATQIIASFYYLTDASDPTSRVIIHNQKFYINSSWIPFTLEFTALPSQPYLDKKLGIQFSTPTGWYGIDEIQASVEMGAPSTWNPTPGNNTYKIDPTMILSWNEPINISNPTYILYLGTDQNNWDITVPGISDTSYSLSLDYVTHYFWRVDTVINSTTYPGNVWQFTTGGKASSPVPAHNSETGSVPITRVSWTAEPYITSFNVHAGESLPLQFIGHITQPDYALSTPKESTTYFWRIDELVGDTVITEGDTWQFTTGLASSATLYGDLTVDGIVDIQDLIILSQQWFGSAGNIADLVGNDGVDMLDFAIIANNWLERQPTLVIINEVHYDPDLKTEFAEFIELFNAGVTDTDLSGWEFTDGISYTFPQGTILAAGDYIVVAQDTVAIQNKYSIPSGSVYGPFQGSLKNSGEKIELADNTGNEVDQVDYQLGFPWPIVGDPVPEYVSGSGHSIQLINQALDNDMAGSWRSAYPTPASQNVAIYASVIPPHIRQVKHSPKQPESNETVTITAKVTDASGVSSVKLLYQIVNPGNYIPIIFSDMSTNAAYENPANWNEIAMHDDGINGDETAGDDTYTVQMPASMQTHRRLIRYRISIKDSASNSLTVPYPDDPQPNFAYFVYDGVPAWSGAINPGGSYPKNELVEYDSEAMSSLPVYHLISRSSDVYNCQYNGSYDNGVFRFAGTIVYDGQVYDHILYRVRGQGATFVWGKNKWKINFNTGHHFQARDNFGEKYKEKWNKMNIATGGCPWWQYPYGYDVGEGGMIMNETLGFKFYQLADVLAPNTNYFQLRVIDDYQETTTNQYEGDFWGLYLSIEQPDSHFLDEHDFPDGNLYKMDGAPSMQNQGPTQPYYSDVNTFTNSSTGYKKVPYQPLSWWEENVNLQSYYSYNAVSTAINNSDRRVEQNAIYYHNPLTDQWSILPWDLDLSFEYAPHNNYETERFRYVLNHTEAEIKWKNRCRELQDLLFNNDQGAQVVDEMAAIIGPFADIDRARWEYAPRMRNKGIYYRQPLLPTPDFAGLVEYMKTIITPTGYGPNYGGGKLTNDAYDPDIPNVPEAVATGSETFPANYLTFKAQNLSDPQGTASLAAIKWRIAEIKPPEQIAPTVQTTAITQLIAQNETWRYFKGTQEPSATVGEWLTANFDDSSWLTGQTSIGYGDNDDNTRLDLDDPPMRYNYNTIYLRKTFEVADITKIESVTINTYVDDGCIIWINGTEVFRSDIVTAGPKFYDSVTDLGGTGGYVNNPVWETPIADSAPNYLVDGTNVICIHVMNAQAGSSDLSIDINLIATLTDDGGDDPDPPLTPSLVKPGKYEVNATWQSEDSSSLTSQVRIPASEIKVGHTYRVRCRLKDNTNRWSHWSDPIEFVAGPQISVPILEDLRITEIMYNPADGSDYEFIELKNIGESTLNLDNVSFTDGITFEFQNSDVTSLAPEAFVLVVKNRSVFTSRYPAVANLIAGEYSGKLANDGETLKLEDFLNGTILEFTYNDSRSWPLAADGAGHSLIPLDSALQAGRIGPLDYGKNWRASSYINGSPGLDDPSLTSSIVINEFLAHTDLSDPAYPNYDSNDWIELYNIAGTSVTFDGNWYLTDDIDNLQKWAIPPATLNSENFVAFDEITGFHTPISTGFGLNKAGEVIILSYLPGNDQDRVVDSIKFKGQENAISLGRYPDGGNYFFNMPPSRNSANSSPIDHLVINEVMYNPEDGKLEYIEIYNPTSQSINLSNSAGKFRINGGISFTFPPGTSISPDSYLVIVDFDPTVSVELQAFQFMYSISSLTPGTNIVGPYIGSLSNGGERIAIEKPQAPDAPEDPTSWIIVDETIYSDSAPWPTSPDGTGDALQRNSTAASQSANNPANWTAAPPTPSN